MTCVKWAIAVLLCAASLTAANAQRTPGVRLTVVIGGMELHFHTFEWTGIAGDQIGLGWRAASLIDPAYKAGKEAMPRWAVDFVCNNRCEQLPRYEDMLRHPAAVKKNPDAPDRVVWKDGTQTRGRVEVRCSNDNCDVFQDGKPVRPDEGANWRLVSFVELAAVKR